MSATYIGMSLQLIKYPGDRGVKIVSLACERYQYLQIFLYFDINM